MRIAGPEGGGNLWVGNDMRGKNIRIDLWHGLGDSYYLEFRNGILVGIGDDKHEYAEGSGFTYDEVFVEKN
jgi:hypothetical protein